jgi:hypothetical protein
LDTSTILKLLFHKLNSVRADLYKTINLLHDLPHSPELFCVASQAVLMETSQVIIAEAFKLLHKHLEYSDLAASLVPRWVEFVSQLQPRDFSFMRVHSFTEGEDPRLVYSFVDSEYEGDLYSKSFLEYKQFLRIKNLAKLLKMLDLSVTGSGTVPAMLRVLTDKADDLEELCAYSGDSPQAAMRVKALAVSRLTKAISKGLMPWPQKLTPLFQALVTSYKVTARAERRRQVAQKQSLQGSCSSNQGGQQDSGRQVHHQPPQRH